jgi:hypothetical protein
MLLYITNKELYSVLMGRVRQSILMGLQVGLKANLEIIPKTRDDANALEKYSLAYEYLGELHADFNNVGCKKEASNFDEKYLTSEYKSVLKRCGVPARCISDLQHYSKLFESDHNDPKCFLPITVELTQEGLKLVCKQSIGGYCFDDSDSTTIIQERVSSNSDCDTNSKEKTEQLEAQGLRPYYG